MKFFTLSIYSKKVHHYLNVNDIHTYNVNIDLDIYLSRWVLFFLFLHPPDTPCAITPIRLYRGGQQKKFYANLQNKILN